METWKGIYKLQEEMGEVGQILGKLGAFPSGDHPDGAGDLKRRLEDELSDLTAAINYVVEENILDTNRMHERALNKLKQFRNWGLTGLRVPVMLALLFLPGLAHAETKTFYNAQGQRVGSYSDDGTIKDQNGTYVGKIDADGVIKDERGARVGTWRDGIVKDNDGRRVGTWRGDELYNEDGEYEGELR